jgi:hypothetical protein
LVSRKAVLREFEEYGLSVPEIVKKYSEWVSEDTYMILNRINLRTYNTDVFAIKCSKRGNDVYRYRVYRRFRELAKLTSETIFFNPKDRNTTRKTKALFVTLTYDTKRCGFDEAWKNIGVEFNRFMAYVRKQFGKVSCCRVFEAYENGHPHIHCILLFEEYEFKVFFDQKGQFRVKEKDVFEAGWHSHTDVKAMSSLGRGFSYLKKYLLKSIDAKNKDSKALKTLALGWLFNKRAFAVSGKFHQMLTDLIKTKHNSNHKIQQITLEREIIQEYTYYVLGFVPADIIHLKKDIWFSKLAHEQLRTVEKYLESKVYALKI